MTDSEDGFDPPAVRRHVQSLQGLDRQKLCARLMDWLCGDDVSRRTAADEICRRCGPAALDLLISEFLAPRKRATTLLKILAAIDRLGMPLSQGQSVTLISSATRVGEGVSRCVLATMFRLRHREASHVLTTSVMPA